MKKKIPVKKLLRWRLAKAKAEAPPPPTAARLLALARPWWETSPERFEIAIRRLIAIQAAQGRPRSRPKHFPPLRSVPAVIVRTADELETVVRILHLELDNGRVQLSFQCETSDEPAAQKLEVTFVSESAVKPLFFAPARKSLSGDYWLEAEYPTEVAENWKLLKSTDRVPFLLILRDVD